MGRFRRDKIKREHEVLPVLLERLQRIAELEPVEGIIPGRIDQRQGSSASRLTFQYFTDSGLRLLGREGGAVQEVFIIADRKESVLDALRQRELIDG